MTPGEYQRVADVFAGACERPDAERAAFLDRACGDDARLRSRVEAMLRSDADGEAFMRDAAVIIRAGVEGAMRDNGDPDHAPTQIGRYCILRKIGDGGMGVVYLAEQDQPRRSVAVKVIRPGVMSRELRRRFEFEAQVLGQLRHPGIAHVYEAGTARSDRGEQSYFAMEFVEGPPLDRYAREHRLGTRDRLELMSQICDAVQYAHQKGVIHRDLKPGNILVEESGRPKVLDFGVARATDADTNTVTLRTDFGQLVGTVPYMSPEQVGGVPADIDTRSDVYALGVICFELLTGRLPHSVRDRSIPEAARIIRDEDPSKLSSVSPALRGDVETIVAKALEKDKTRRYQSAAEMAGDIRRYLRDEPIVARPASTIYQLRKFARRNKGLVGGVAAAIVVLIAGIITTTWFAVEASAERDLATRARDRARIEAAKAAAINDFLVRDMLGAADPLSGQGQSVTVVEAVEKSVPRIAEAFADQPEVETEMHATVGLLLGGLGRFDLAEKESQTALAMIRDRHGKESPEALKAATDLGLLYFKSGAHDEGLEILTETLRILRAQPQPDQEAIIEALNGIGHIVYQRREFDRAMEIYREAQDICESLYGKNEPRTIRNRANIAGVLYNLERRDESLAIMQEILDLEIAEHGEHHLGTSGVQYDLAVNLFKLGRYQESEAMFRRCLQTRGRLLGEDHPAYADAMYQYGRLLVATGRFDEARSTLERALAAMRAKYSRDHEHIAKTLNALAFVYRNQDDHKSAEPVFQESYEIYCRTRGPESTAAAISKLNIGTNLFHQNRFAEAEPVIRAGLELHERAFEEGDWHVANACVWLGRCLTELGRYPEAEQHLLNGQRKMIAALGQQDERALEAVRWLTALYEKWDKPDAAAKWRTRGADPSTASFSPSEPPGN